MSSFSIGDTSGRVKEQSHISFKVDVPNSDNFLSTTTSNKIQRYAIRERWLAYPNRGRSHLPHNFWSRYRSTIAV